MSEMVFTNFDFEEDPEIDSSKFSSSELPPSKRTKEVKTETKTSKEQKVFKRWKCSYCSTVFNYCPTEEYVEQKYFNCVDYYSRITISTKRMV